MWQHLKCIVFQHVIISCYMTVKGTPSFSRSEVQIGKRLLHFVGGLKDSTQ